MAQTAIVSAPERSVSVTEVSMAVVSAGSTACGGVRSSDDAALDAGCVRRQPHHLIPEQVHVQQA